MPNNRETVAIVHEAMEAVNRIVTHLSVAGCLVGSGRPPRGTAKAPRVEYQFSRVALWMRCFADEAYKLDRVIGRDPKESKAIDESIRAVIRSNMVGVVGNVACFPEIRFVEFWDQRRAMDVTTCRYNGPVSVEIITATTGERVSVIAIADAADVASHPRGKVAHAR